MQHHLSAFELVVRIIAAVHGPADRDGRVSAGEGREFLLKSGLSQNALAQVQPAMSHVSGLTLQMRSIVADLEYVRH